MHLLAVLMLAGFMTAAFGPWAGIGTVMSFGLGFQAATKHQTPETKEQPR